MKSLEAKAKRAAYGKAYHAAHREEIAIKDKAYYVAHREERRIYGKAYYLAHREEASVYGKARYVAHLDEIKAYRKAYAATHKKEITDRRKIYYAANKEKLKARSRAYGATHRKEISVRGIMQRHGLSQVAFEALLNIQSGMCAICGKKDWNGKRPHIDHDHVTGKIRGILCSVCNLILGQIDDNLEIVQAMGDYLKKFQNEGESKC